MKFSIAAKLALLQAAVGLLAAGVTGYQTYNHSRQMLVAAAQKELLSSTQVLGRRIATAREGISRDLQVLAQHPAARAMLEQPRPESAQQLTTLFKLLMQANPGYFQVRLISAQQHGLEVVRVDRNGQQLLPITGDDLQEKGHFGYVTDTLRLPPGETYLSRFMINHERGSNAAQDRPSAQLAMPIHGNGKQPLGLVVINLDVNRTFTQLAQDLPADFHLYLANQQGDILLHPDESRTFGFDRGRRVLIQDEFPATAALVTGQTNQVVQNIASTPQRNAMAVAFMAFPVQVSSAESTLLLGLSQPLAGLQAEVDRLRQNVLQLMAAISLASLLVAIWLARVVTRPLEQLTTATRHFADTQNAGQLPVQRQDEIGELARTFGQMAQQIQQQMQALQDNQEEFEYLAHHDTLTSLPNRRMLHDRLVQAIAHAQRLQETVTLLFIDLDNFKHINDTLGHDAGDTVLMTVAQRLHQMVRTNDTVARLGGDEFIVLLDGVMQRNDIEHLATQLRQALKATIELHGQPHHISASIGISQYPHDGQAADELLASADQAMYRVKAQGRDAHGFATVD